MTNKEKVRLVLELLEEKVSLKEAGGVMSPTPGKKYQISPAGSTSMPYFVIEATDGSEVVDMQFSEERKAAIFAEQKGFEIEAPKRRPGQQTPEEPSLLMKVANSRGKRPVVTDLKRAMKLLGPVIQELNPCEAKTLIDQAYVNLLKVVRENG